MTNAVKLTLVIALTLSPLPLLAEVFCCQCRGEGGSPFLTPTAAGSNCRITCMASGGSGSGRPSPCPPWPQPQGQPLPGQDPGTTVGSFAAGIGGKDNSSRCEIHTAHFDPPLVAVVGKPFTTGFTWGRLGGGQCNIHSGGAVEWGDGSPVTSLTTAVPTTPDACSGQFSRLVAPGERVTHVYREPGRYVIRGWAQGDFKAIDGSFRCRNQRQDWITVQAVPSKP